MIPTFEDNRTQAQASYFRGDVVLSSKPEIVAIEGTNYCNLKCVMCPRGEPDIMRRPLGHMSDDVLRAIIEKSDQFAQPCWFHWMGEPLMNPNVFAQIELAKEKIPQVGISTNATLLHEENQQRILDSSLDVLLIALDGDTKEVYERTRKSARFTFEEVCANAEGFLARRASQGRTRPTVIMSFIVMDDNAADAESFKEHWQRLGADVVLVKTMINWGGQEPEVFDVLQVADRKEKLASPRPHPCKFMWESVMVTWDGKVSPCCYDFDAKMVMGDLKTQTMDEIWNGPAYVALRRAELEGRNNCELCANCSQAPGGAVESSELVVSYTILGGP